ncbi:MAG: ribonuclease P protein component [Candidatus Daviesbacteria bacterium]|nr:ribonuclease P protein component [Candidatus Daviesbacteria bacterium]
MLPKSQRLNLKKDFKWVVAGQKLESKYLKLFFKRGDNQTPRVGIAGSSKTFKKATERNRARRLTSKAFESIYSELPKNINIVALPKAGITSVKSDLVLLDLESTLKNAKIID